VSRTRLAVLAGLFLAALALRPQLVGVGPLIPRIQADLGVSHAVAGLLGTIPVLCMGAFAVPGSWLGRRYGSRVAIAGCLALIAVFGIGRSLIPGAAGVIALTLGVGIGMGLAQTLLPIAVKERFAHRPGFATGIYAMGINVGSALSSAAAVPISHAGNGWRSSILAFSLGTAVLLVGWIALTRNELPHRRADVEHVRLPWRSGLAWRLVLTFGLMSMVFYGLNSWLPDAYVEHGWSEGRAGALLAVLNITALLPTLLVPWLSDRTGSRRRYLVILSLLFVLGVVGFVALPGGGWAWAAIAGLGVGGLFPMVMTLPLDVARRPAEVGAVAAMMLGVGYFVSGLSPFVLGAVRDASGGFTAVLSVLSAGAVGLLLISATMSGERLRRGAIPEPVAL
jgi:CP family cyanate transporter-like MFS transporter